MDLTIAHMVLVHERTALSLDALVTAHVLIVVTVYRVGLVFPLEGPFPTLSLRQLQLRARPLRSTLWVGPPVRVSSHRRSAPAEAGDRLRPFEVGGGADPRRGGQAMEGAGGRIASSVDLVRGRVSGACRCPVR